MKAESPNVINLILCGGVGSRLWPLSRKLLPKQFARLLPGNSLFERTVMRNREISSRIMIAANRHQAFLAFNQMDSLGMHEHSGLIEPVGRNTAPAIALSAMLVSPDDILLVSPSDHLIDNEQAYSEAVTTAVELASRGRIVTFGIKPAYPETGFGYIEAANPGGDAGATSVSDPYEVRGFREKPDHATAASYLEAGNYFWNSGMFCFSAGVFLNELSTYAPEVYNACIAAFEAGEGSQARDERVSWEPGLDAMNAIPAISVDYAVMEKSEKMAVVPCDIGWSDLGSLDALFDYYEAKKSDDNQSEAALNISDTATKPVFVNSRGNLVLGDDRQVALIGAENLMVVETPDALLIAKRGDSQRVKDVVQELESREDGRRRTERFPTIERPWGRYTTLHSEDHCIVRRIEIKSGSRTSLQRHHKREEHWTIVSGQALVQIERSRKHYYPGQGIEVPMGAYHRMENPGPDPLVIIETQLAARALGEGVRVPGDSADLPALDEADVERIEDDYRWI